MDATFIIELAEDKYKVLKYILGQPVFVCRPYDPASGQDKAIDLIAKTLKELNYRNEALIICLGHDKATSRYLKIPSRLPEEIEKIVSLQAPRYLPCPIEELILAYDIIGVDKDGYTDVSMMIAHKDVINPYLELAKNIGSRQINIVMSSYGLYNLYMDNTKPAGQEAVMLVDLDGANAHLVIVYAARMVFSRYFRLPTDPGLRAHALALEIHKTHNVYLKEVAKPKPEKIIFTTSPVGQKQDITVIAKETNTVCEYLDYAVGPIFNNAFDRLASEVSWASMIGLGIKGADDNLNLLPGPMKNELRSNKSRKRYLFYSGVIAVCAMFILGGFSQRLAAKGAYVKMLKGKIQTLASQAREYEQMDQTVSILESRQKRDISGLEVIAELHRLMPQELALTSITYEQDKQIILRGISSQLNSVFKFASALESAHNLKNFVVRVRYATKRQAQTEETVDFEIDCTKE